MFAVRIFDISDATVAMLRHLAERLRITGGTDFPVSDLQPSINVNKVGCGGPTEFRRSAEPWPASTFVNSLLSKAKEPRAVGTYNSSVVSIIPLLVPSTRTHTNLQTTQFYA